jgi:peptidoglycan/LPS O-acetylase OafA/YrhL
MAAASRFHNLDALRGLAALTVLLYHIGPVIRPDKSFAPGGYLAVDFFFLLSGFVIAQAYDARLAGGMTFGRFAMLRIIRMYPMLFAGFLIGCIKPILMILLHYQTAPQVGDLLGSMAANLLVLPAPAATIGAAFPINAPMWSLFFELVINFVYALVLVEAPAWVLGGIIAVSGVVIGFGVFTHPDLNLGWGWSNMIYGFARVSFSFPIGLLAFRLGAARRRKPTPLAFAPMVLMVGVMLLPPATGFRSYLDAAILLVVFPLLLWWSVGMEMPLRLAPAASFIGDLSYPLYAIHFPMLVLTMAVLHTATEVTVTIFAAVALTAAFIAMKFYDKPVRRWLMRRVSGAGERRPSAP